MAFSITTRKELIKHVPFDVSVITDNLKDGMFFAEDKKITTHVLLHLLGHQFGGIQGDIDWLRNTYASRKRAIQRDATLPDPV